MRLADDVISFAEGKGTIQDLSFFQREIDSKKLPLIEIPF